MKYGKSGFPTGKEVKLQPVQFHGKNTAPLQSWVRSCFRGIYEGIFICEMQSSDVCARQIPLLSETLNTDHLYPQWLPQGLSPFLYEELPLPFKKLIFKTLLTSEIQHNPYY